MAKKRRGLGLSLRSMLIVITFIAVIIRMMYGSMQLSGIADRNRDGGPTLIHQSTSKPLKPAVIKEPTREDHRPDKRDDNIKSNDGGSLKIGLQFTSEMGKAWRTFTGEKGAVFPGERGTITTEMGGDEPSEVRIPGHITFWGKSSAKLRLTKRRSMVVTLDKKVSFGGVDVSKFLLMSLWEDDYRLAYATTAKFLEGSGIWSPYTKLVEVYCTGDEVTCGAKKSFGVYLLIEFPKDAITRTISTSLSRGDCMPEYSHSSNFDDVDVGVRVWKYHPKPAYYDIISFPTFKGGGELSSMYRSLEQKKRPPSEVVHLPQYLLWLAMNSLLENGDYDDEVFFIALKGTQSPLLIHAWDFDNVFQPCHKEGKFALSHELFFCAESDLDKKIIKEPALLSQYKESLQCVLSSFTPQRWEAAVDSTLSDLTKLMTLTKEMPSISYEGKPVPDFKVGAEKLKKSFTNRHGTLSGRLGLSEMKTNENKVTASDCKKDVSVDKPKSVAGKSFYSFSSRKSIKHSGTESGLFCDEQCGSVVVVRDTERGSAEWAVAPYTRPLVPFYGSDNFERGDGHNFDIIRPHIIDNKDRKYPFIITSTLNNDWDRRDTTFEQTPLPYGKGSFLEKGRPTEAKRRRFPTDQQTIQSGVYHLKESFTVEKNSLLTIQPGTTVIVDPGVVVTIIGKLVLSGEAGMAIYFLGSDENSPWGGFILQQGASLIVKYSVISGTGGKPYKRDKSTGTHFKEIPAITLLQDSKLLLSSSAIVDCLGPGFGAAKNADVLIENSLLQRLFQGGECKLCSFKMVNTAVLDMPNREDGTYRDNDNDGLYLSGGDHSVTGCVIAFTADDCIDTGTPSSVKKKGGHLTVQNTILDGCQHEGLAISGVDRKITVTNTVFRRCQQCLEMGYSDKHTSAQISLSLFQSCDVAIRYGDNYVKMPFGSLSVSSSVVSASETLNVLNLVRKNVAAADRLSITSSVMGPIAKSSHSTSCAVSEFSGSAQSVPTLLISKPDSHTGIPPF